MFFGILIYVAYGIKNSSGLGWVGSVWFVLYGLGWIGLVWIGLGWFGLGWFGLGWFGLVWVGIVWFGMV